MREEAEVAAVTLLDLTKQNSDSQAAADGLRETARITQNIRILEEQRDAMSSTHFKIYRIRLKQER